MRESLMGRIHGLLRGRTISKPLMVDLNLNGGPAFKRQQADREGLRLGRELNVGSW